MLRFCFTFRALSTNVNIQKFKKDINNILNIFSIKKEENISKIIDKFNVVLVSFDLDLDGNFNDKWYFSLLE
jgi:hypothetical protein